MFLMENVIKILKLENTLKILKDDIWNSIKHRKTGLPAKTVND